MANRIVPCSKDGKKGVMVENTNGPCYTYSNPAEKIKALGHARKQLTAVLFSQHKIGRATELVKEAFQYLRGAKQVIIPQSDPRQDQRTPSYDNVLKSILDMAGTATKTQEDKLNNVIQVDDPPIL